MTVEFRNTHSNAGVDRDATNSVFFLPIYKPDPECQAQYLINKDNDCAVIRTSLSTH